MNIVCSPFPMRCPTVRMAGADHIEPNGQEAT